MIREMGYLWQSGCRVSLTVYTVFVSRGMVKIMGVIDDTDFPLRWLENYLRVKCKLITTTVSSRVEGHAKIGGPERFVNTGKVKIHASERFYCVLIRFDFHVSHLAQPEIHSLSSPVSIFTEENTVAFDESTKRSFVGRYISIIH